MIVLQYSTLTDEVKEVQSRLESLVLSHKVEETENLNEPILISGKDRFSGKQEISAFLEELGGELQQWYHCACR